MQTVHNVLEEQTRALLLAMGGDMLRRWQLARMPSTADLQTRLRNLEAQIERGHQSLAALEESTALGPESRALARSAHLLALRQRDAERERLEAEIQDAEERDRLQRDRPEGCFCLGLGGRGYLLLVREQWVWQEFCSCPDGLRLLALADQARAEAEAEERAEQERREREARERETRDRLSRAYLPPRTEPYTLADFREPEKRGAVLRLECFGTREPQRGVLLWGGFGTGKTTMACCALRAWIQAGGSGLFVTLSDYLEWLRPPGERVAQPPHGAIERLGQVGLLVLDDIGLERLTRWGYEQVFRLVNRRYDAQLPTIYTSNYDPDELVQRLTPDGADLREGQRIVERLIESCDVIEVRGRNYRARRAS